MTPNILSSKFKYFNSSDTDLRRTFARVRKEQAESVKQAEADKLEVSKKVATIKRGVK